MTNREILRLAAETADTATESKFDGARPSPTNAAGDYWKLVFDAAVATLNKTENGRY
jgi:hypothetical protein